MYCRVTVFLLSCFLSVNMLSGMELLHFRKYTVDNGLSDNCVTTITQDQDGYMWFGTRDGLCRFDGYTFDCYRKFMSSGSMSGDNTINHLMVDSSDKLWVSTTDGVYIYDREKDSFDRFRVLTDTGETLPPYVNCTCADGAGVYWFATSDHGVYKYDVSDSALVRYTVGNTAGGLPSDVINRIIKDASGNIWVATAGGLALYNREIDRFMYYPGNGDFGKNEMMSVYEDSGGNIWVGTWNGGLGRLNRNMRDFTVYLSPENETFVSHIRTIREYRQGELMIGSDDGLYMFGTNSGTCWRVDNPKDFMSLSDQNVYDIYQDKEGGMWFATYFGGVNYLYNYRYNDGIRHYYPSTGNCSISGKAVSNFCEDDAGNIWIATEDNGISYFNRRTGHFRNYMPSPDKGGLSYHNVHSLLAVGDRLLIGTFSRGLDILDLNTGEFENCQLFPSNLAHINNNSVFSMFRSSTGDIYVGTAFGLYIFDLDTRTLESAGLDVFIRSIAEDHLGNIWIASYFTGAYCRKPGTGEWKNYYPDSSVPNSICYNRLTGVYVDDNQRLWFTSQGGGICKYNYGEDDFTVINEEAGLASNVTYGLLNDSRGNIWVSTNRGISVIDPETWDIRNLDMEDGLQSNQFNYLACLKSRDGLLFFGGINGFNIINPDCIYINTDIPPVHISSVIDAVGKEINLYGNGKKIALTYDSSIFTVNVSVLSFVAPECNRVQYRLSETDEWREVNDRRSITFYNLPSGHYNLMVRGANSDGIWNYTGDTLSITILPPLWKSRVAYFVYILILLCFLALIIFFIIKRYRTVQERRLDDIRKEQEKEIYKNKINFFTSIAHEIRTPLSLIKAPLEMIVASRDSGENFEENLKVIEKNTDRLTELIDQLLDFRKIEEDKYRLKYEKFDAMEIFRKIFFRYGPEADKRNIRLELVPDFGIFTMLSDPDAVTKIIGNIVDNGLKYAESYVRIEVDITEENMSVRILNDGDMIPEEYVDKIFDPFYRVEQENVYEPRRGYVSGTGLGLSLVRQLVTGLSGSISVTSSVTETAFAVILPRRTGFAGEYHEAELSDDNGSCRPDIRPDLMIIEDNADLRDFLQKNLADRYNVMIAADGEDALRQVARRNVDIVVSDVVMPRMDGIEFLKLLKSNELYSHIPVILLSARTSDEANIEGLKSGAEVYITKPFSINVLRAQLASIMENRKLARDRFLHLPFGKDGKGEAGIEDTFLLKMDKVIMDNISNERFSVKDLARELAVSQSKMQRKIKSLVGLVPNEYIRLTRLKHAAELLSQGQYQINEVAYLSGFNTPSYFSHCFFEQFGILPGDFIRQKKDL